MASIDIQDLSKSYTLEDGSELSVLRRIDVTIHDNEFFSVLGPSGCGKSTLLSILAELTDMDSGEVHIKSNGTGEGTRPPKIGFVFQDPTLLDWKTVRENIKFGLNGMGVPENEHEERINDALQRVGLSEFANEYPQSLSGGMRQRVGLARALAIDPDVLMMDEPFSSVDEITARKLRDDLLQIWRDTQKTVVFVTHHIPEAVYMSDRIAVLSEGPAEIVEIIDINIDRPRTPDDPDLVAYEHEVLTALGLEPE